MIERYAFVFLLAADFFAILISMVAGPLDYETVAISTAISACIISGALILYGLYFWNRRDGRGS